MTACGFMTLTALPASIFASFITPAFTTPSSGFFIALCILLSLPAARLTCRSAIFSAARFTAFGALVRLKPSTTAALSGANSLTAAQFSPSMPLLPVTLSASQ